MQSEESLYRKLLSLVAPETILKDFDLTDVKEKNNSIILFFEEKKENIPEALQGKEVVSAGFENSIELQAFPVNDKKLYVSIKRRRWKEKGKNDKTYHNQYSLHRPGMKTTKEFGDFLKEELGLLPDEFNKFWEVPSD